jgi:hypothetical protein
LRCSKPNPLCLAVLDPGALVGLPGEPAAPSRLRPSGVDVAPSLFRPLGFDPVEFSVRGRGLEPGKRSVEAFESSLSPKLGEERVESPIVPPGVAMPLRSLGTASGALGLTVPPPGVEPSPDDPGTRMRSPQRRCGWKTISYFGSSEGDARLRIELAATYVPVRPELRAHASGNVVGGPEPP